MRKMKRNGKEMIIDACSNDETNQRSGVKTKVAEGEKESLIRSCKFSVKTKIIIKTEKINLELFGKSSLS